MVFGGKTQAAICQLTLRHNVKETVGITIDSIIPTPIVLTTGKSLEMRKSSDLLLAKLVKRVIITQGITSVPMS